MPYLKKNSTLTDTAGNIFDLSSIIMRVEDGSYVVRCNALPYHVPDCGEWAELWREVNAWALAHPERVTEERNAP